MSVQQPAVASGEFLIGGDLKVWRLGFGAMRITGMGIWGPPRNHAGAIAVLKRALELGINLIDTADAYGPDVSENLIAEALYPYPAELVIATKGGLLRDGPDQWRPDGRPEHLRNAIDGSLKRLKLERIDLYQFHRPDPNVRFADSIGALADLQRQGKIQHIGLSNVSPEQLKEAQGIVPIVSVQNRYNLTDRSSEALVDICAEQGIGFIPWFPLATGNLARRGSPLAKIAQANNVQPSQVALAWLLRRSRTMLPIPGTSSVAHLEENTHGATIQLSDADYETLNKLHT
jgi:pyridoxine 4-dehydrogenase